MKNVLLGVDENEFLVWFKNRCIDFMYNIFDDPEAFHIDGFLSSLIDYYKLYNYGIISLNKNPEKNFSLDIKLFKLAQLDGNIEVILKTDHELHSKLILLNESIKYKYIFHTIKTGVSEILVFKLPLLFAAENGGCNYYIFIENKGDFIPFFLNDSNSTYYFNLLSTIIESWNNRLIHNSTILLKSCNFQFSQILSEFHSNSYIFTNDRARLEIKKLYVDGWKIALNSKETIDLLNNRNIFNYINDSNCRIQDSSKLLEFIRKGYLEDDFTLEELDEIKDLLPEDDIFIAKIDIDKNNTKNNIKGLHQMVKEKLLSH